MNHLKNAQRVAKIMDGQFKVLGFRFGLDPILGLIPGFGDTLTVILSFYLIWIAIHMNLPRNAVIMMIVNLIFDYALSLIPILGDISDFAFKANERNFSILKKYAEPEEGEVETPLEVIA